MDKYIKCRVCGKGISVDEVGGYNDINFVYCENCAVKTDIETNKPDKETKNDKSWMVWSP